MSKARAGGTWSVRRGEETVAAGMADWAPSVKADEAAKSVATILKAGQFAVTELGGCRLCITGPFGLAWFDVIVEGGEGKLRRTA